MRCFVAIKLDSQITRQLECFQGHLKMDARLDEHGIRWSRPDLIHLTLKFLGEVDDIRLMDVCSAVTDAAGRFDPFDFEIADSGCFPPEGSAKIIWAGITTGQKELRALHEVLDDNLAQAGFDREVRVFSPHLTLARIKQPKKGRQVSSAIKEAKVFDVGIQAVSELTVFESTLTRQGPEYMVMHSVELGK